MLNSHVRKDTVFWDISYWRQKSHARLNKCRGNRTSRSLTPSQQAEAPEESKALIKGRKQQGIEVKRLHQEPEKIGHYTVVTEDHRDLTGKLDRKKTGRKRRTWAVRWWGGGSRREVHRCHAIICPVKMSQYNQEPLVLTVERVQWLVSSLENRVASFMNTATAFRMNVTKSWMWMKFLAQCSLLPKDQKSNKSTGVLFSAATWPFKARGAQVKCVVTP